MAEEEEKNDSVPGTEVEAEADAPELEVPGSEGDQAEPEAAVVEPETVPGTDDESTADAAELEVPGTAAAPAAPAQVQGKKQRKLKHVPRSLRRTRSKVKREPASPRKAIVRIPKPESDRNARQERRGVVVSDKGDKTIIVKVDVQKIHPKYKKVVRSTTRFHAHDEANTAGVGDTVRIVETRPLSKLKHWRLAEIVEKAK